MTDEIQPENLSTGSLDPSEPLTLSPESLPGDEVESAAETEVTDQTPIETAVPESSEQNSGSQPPDVELETPAEDPTHMRPLLEEHSAQLNALRQAFDDKLAIDQHKEKQIELLHRELQEHKRGLLVSALRPLLIGMIRLHDSLGREAHSLSSEVTEAMAPEQVGEILEGFKDDLEILLEDQGVQLFRVAEASFDPHRQTVLQGIPTDDETQTGLIARRVRPGFELDGATLQKERVEVFTAQT